MTGAASVSAAVDVGVDPATGAGFEFGRITVWEAGARLVFIDLTSSTPPDSVSGVEERGSSRRNTRHRGRSPSTPHGDSLPVDTEPA